MLKKKYIKFINFLFYSFIHAIRFLNFLYVIFIKVSLFDKIDNVTLKLIFNYYVK